MSQLPYWVTQCGNFALLYPGTSFSGATVRVASCIRASAGDGGSGLGIARSSFCYWRRTAADRAARQAADAALATRIRAVHRESDGTYGVPRITAELRDDGERINHKRIARVMRSIGLAGVRLRRRHRTTIADPAAAKAPDLIGRDFTANEPNTKYVGDITYRPVDGGKFLYLATVIDLASRRLTGWAIADHMRTDLVIDEYAKRYNRHRPHRSLGQRPPDQLTSPEPPIARDNTRIRRRDRLSDLIYEYSQVA
ncbi:hypothetical protein GCM10010246_84480 [Streptomyces cuspidosporus]|uniref:Transposase n=1 Tax=Streptomyces cuspidosporus TaxID=66882 RepID=A0ABN3HDH0_9ACTN